MSTAVSRILRGREEAPMDDEMYDFTRQRKQADLLQLNCALLEKKLLLCSVRTMLGKCEESTFIGIIISGAKDISTLTDSQDMLYVKVKCGDAVFHTHPFEKEATDWASAPMEIKWSEVPPPPERRLTVSLMSQAGQELAVQDVEVDLAPGHGFDRWITLAGSACLRLQVEHKGVPSTSTASDLESEILDLVSKRRHLRATLTSALPPASYATYTSVVSEVERRLCARIDDLEAALEGRLIARRVDPTSLMECKETPGAVTVYDDGPCGPVRVVQQPPVMHCRNATPPPPPPDDHTPLVQTLMATLTGRNSVIRQLQETLAGIEAGQQRNSAETILLLATQLEERETTLAQLKAHLPPLSLSTLIIDQSNVINTLLAQLHKALGSMNQANKAVEQLTGQATLFGGDVVMKAAAEVEDPVLTPAQVATLLARFDEVVRRNKELEGRLAPLEERNKELHHQELQTQIHVEDLGRRRAELENYVQALEKRRAELEGRLVGLEKNDLPAMPLPPLPPCCSPALPPDALAHIQTLERRNQELEAGQREINLRLAASEERARVAQTAIQGTDLEGRCRALEVTKLQLEEHLREAEARARKYETRTREAEALVEEQEEAILARENHVRMVLAKCEGAAGAAPTPMPAPCRPTVGRTDVVYVTQPPQIEVHRAPREVVHVHHAAPPPQVEIHQAPPEIVYIEKPPQVEIREVYIEKPPHVEIREVYIEKPPHVEIREVPVSVPCPELESAVACLTEQVNGSLQRLGEVCFFLTGDVGEAAFLQQQLPPPLAPPPACLPPTALARHVDLLRDRLADAHLVIYGEAKNALPRMERLRFLQGQAAQGDATRCLELKLRARDQDFNDLLVDHEGLLVALASARQQLAAPQGVTDPCCDALLLDACAYLTGLLPQAERGCYDHLPPRTRLPALLRVLHCGGVPAVTVTPITYRGVTAAAPFVRGRVGAAVQQTQGAGPTGRWDTPLTFALDGAEKDLHLELRERDRPNPIGRAALDLDRHPHGTETWVPLEGGGELLVRLDRTRLPAQRGRDGTTQAGLCPSQAELDGVAQKLENSIDVLSRGTAHVLRPNRVTPSYLHRLADLLWELTHGGAGPLLPPGASSSSAGASGKPGKDASKLRPPPHPSAVDWDGLDAASQLTMQFLMRSRAGLIRRIWACLQICKVSNTLASRHHALFSHNRGHKMDIGEFKRALEDLAKLLGEVGSLEDGLSWIVANYFTDTEKRDLGTSPHLYPARHGVKALPGLIESTDMIDARELSPARHRPSPTRYRHPSPHREDFLRRLEDAHITVLDAKDGALDGKYYGHDLRAVQHLDGDVHGLLRRRVY